MADTAILTCISNYEAVLLADSTSPQPSYKIDGKEVSQSEWRQNLLDLIRELQDTYNQRNPMISWSAGVPLGVGPYPWIT